MSSPCIRVCRLNQKKFCVGCKRSEQEIVDWMCYSEEKRQQIINELKDRKIK